MHRNFNHIFRRLSHRLALRLCHRLGIPLLTSIELADACNPRVVLLVGLAENNPYVVVHGDLLLVFEASSDGEAAGKGRGDGVHLVVDLADAGRESAELHLVVLRPCFPMLVGRRLAAAAAAAWACRQWIHVHRDVQSLARARLLYHHLVHGSRLSVKLTTVPCRCRMRCRFSTSSSAPPLSCWFLRGGGKRKLDTAAGHTSAAPTHGAGGGGVLSLGGSRGGGGDIDVAGCGRWRCWRLLRRA